MFPGAFQEPYAGLNVRHEPHQGEELMRLAKAAKLPLILGGRKYSTGSNPNSAHRLLHHIIIHDKTAADVAAHVLGEVEAVAKVGADGGGVAFVHAQAHDFAAQVAGSILGPAQGLSLIHI